MIPALGILFGVLNTITVHMAKAMQRHGIDTLRWGSTPKEQRSRKKALIYGGGIAVNGLSGLWLILANRFAPPAYATGMFGVGLVLLLLYSRAVLHEDVAPINYFGALLVIIGTAVFGYDALTHQAVDVAGLRGWVVAVFAAGYFGMLGVVIALAKRSGRMQLFGVAFGAVTGGLAGLDPVLKAIGQYADGTARLLPGTALGWIPFVLSLVVGLLAFLVGQYAFFHGAAANDLVPGHSTAFVLVPVVVQLIALPGYRFSLWLGVGIFAIVSGIVLIQFRNENPKESP